MIPARTSDSALRPSIRPALRTLAAVALVAMLAGGCSNLLPGTSEPPRLFTLTPKTTFDPNLPRASWQLTIDVPLAEAGINTTRIALSHDPVTLEYYARAEWVDRAPLLVQRLLVESFEATHRIVAVARQSINLRPDFSLICDLREFQAEYRGAGPPQVRVRLSAKLVKMPERTIVGSTDAETFVRAAGPELEDVVRAFDTALGKTLKRVVEWTLVTGAREIR
jgi:cholesterol transport system auxiliary component